MMANHLLGHGPEHDDIFVSPRLYLRSALFDPARGVCVHFAPGRFSREDASVLARHWEINVISVLCSGQDWYQYPDVAEAQDALATALRRFPRSVLLGASMGGHAALHWSGPVGASAVLAFSPQAAIGPALPAADTRWRADQVRIAATHGFPHDDLAATLSRSAEIVVAYDPYDVDAEHVAVIEAIRPVHRLLAPFTGHATMRELAKDGLTSALLRDLLSANFDVAAWQHRLRTERSRGGRMRSILRRRGPERLPSGLIRHLALAHPPGDRPERLLLLHAAITTGRAREAEALLRALLDDDGFVRSRAFLAGTLRAAPLLQNAGSAVALAAHMLDLAAGPPRWEAEEPIIQDVARRLGRDARDAGILGRSIAKDRVRVRTGHLLAAAAQLLAEVGAREAAARAAHEASGVLDAWDEANLPLGEIFAKLGDTRGAAAMGRRAVAMNPTELRGYILLSAALEEEKAWEAVAALWRDALSAGADSLRATQRLARALSFLRRHSEMLEVVANSLAQRPEDLGLLRLRAGAEAALGRHADAAASRRIILARAPDDATSHHQLSLSLVALGRRAEAVEASRRAASLAPQNAGMHRHLQRLEAAMTQESAS